MNEPFLVFALLPVLSTVLLACLSLGLILLERSVPSWKGKGMVALSIPIGLHVGFGLASCFSVIAYAFFAAVGIDFDLMPDIGKASVVSAALVLGHMSSRAFLRRPSRRNSEPHQ
jgi:hypothetical protein